MSKATLEDIVSLCKRRGFIYQGSEIYGGLAGTWDYGPLGAQLKRNIVNEWLKFFVDGQDDMYLVDTPILMNPKVWQASGHLDTFHDPLVECGNCHSRFRADKIDTSVCPSCGNKDSFREPVNFNLMFNTVAGPDWGSFETTDKTHVAGTIEVIDNATRRKTSQVQIREGDDFNSVIIYDKNSRLYLRPETAQGMFTNFKNIVDSFSPDLPFGIAQVGRAFRNEISPRDFLFRTREFEIMEFEYFLHPDDWEKKFEKWRKDTQAWFKHIGLSENKIKEIEVPASDRAHYSKRTIDFHYDFPSLGFDEVAGLAYRGSFDLDNHEKKSGKNLKYIPKDGGKPFIPHVIEPTFGLDRHLMAVLSNAYSEDQQGGEKRIFLKLPPNLAPVKVAVFPLLKNKPELVKKAREVYKMLQKEVGAVEFDDNGNIGKRYRRQDEIGTPYCVTIDFQTLEDDTVTVRNRDTTEQNRVQTTELQTSLK